MKLSKSILCFFTSAVFASAVSSAAFAQTEISRRTERLATNVVGTRESTVGPQGQQIREMVAQSSRITDATTIDTDVQITEVEVVTYGFQFPDFKADDLYTRLYRFGMFFDTGNGSGTLEPDQNGYVEFDLTLHQGQGVPKIYFYSFDVKTAEVELFLDIDDLTVNRAVGILAGAARNASNNVRLRQQGGGWPFPPGRRFGRPPEVGEQRWLGLHGDHLTPGAIQDEIFRQTRCNVEEEDGEYYLESCQ